MKEFASLFIILCMLNLVASIRIVPQPNMNRTARMFYTCGGSVIRDFVRHGARSIYYSIPDESKHLPLGFVWHSISYNAMWTWTVADQCVSPGVIVPMPSVYVMFSYGDSNHDYKESVKNQLRSVTCNAKHWLPSVRVVVFLMVHNPIKHGEKHRHALKVIQALWEYAVFNCAVVVIEENGSSGFIFTANPYDVQNNCGKKVSVINELYKCNEFANTFTETLKLAPSKFPNCKLRVLLKISPPYSYLSLDKTSNRRYDGSDIYFVELIKERLGFEVEYILVHDLIRNIAFTDQLYRIISHNEVDMAIGGFPLMVEYYYNVSFLTSYDLNHLHFYLPRPRAVPFLVYSTMFKRYSWYAVAAIILLNILLIYYFRQRKNTSSISYLIIIGVMTQQSMALPKNNLFRMLFSGFLFTLFILSVAYSSLLHSFILNPPSPKLITTLKQLYSGDPLKIVITPSTISFVKKLIDSAEIVNLNQLYSTIDLKTTIFNSNMYRNFTILAKDKAMSFFQTKWNSDLYSVDEPLCGINIVSIVPKGSLFAVKFNLLIRDLLENGVFHKWVNEQTYGYGFKSRGTSFFINRYRPLKTDDLYVAFCMLIFGMVLSIFTFIIELIINWRKQKLRFNTNVSTNQFML